MTTSPFLEGCGTWSPGEAGTEQRGAASPGLSSGARGPFPTPWHGVPRPGRISWAGTCMPGVLGWQTGGWSWASEGHLTQAPSSSVRLCLAAGAQAAGQAGAVLEGHGVAAWAPTAVGRGGQPVLQLASPPIIEGPSLGSTAGHVSPLSLGRGLASRADACLPSKR